MLDVVPSAWVNLKAKPNVCRWPPYSTNSRIVRAAKASVQPETNWKRYVVKVIHKSRYYQNAVKALKRFQAQEDSDIEMFSPESTVESTPRRQFLEKVRSLVQSPRAYKCPEGYSGLDYDLEGADHSNDGFPTQAPQKKYLSHEERILEEHQFKEPFDAEPLDDELLEAVPLEEEGDQLKTFTIGDKSCNNCIKLQGQLKVLFDILKSIKSQVDYNRELLEKREVSKEAPRFSFNLLESYEECSLLNEELENDSRFLTFLKHFGTIGGRDAADNCRRILTNLFSNDLARTLNWVGTSMKRSIQEYPRIIQLIA
ncbi:uncharacterized protein, partial [Parasteatoda tepidariorum]|uniref:uncharacterized protein n=1 Tax=Parasteatoda tepidariorum TaxID=114398 RepID=UPI0039BCCEEA